MNGFCELHLSFFNRNIVWDTRNVAVSELCEVEPICFLIVPASVFTGAHSKCGYSNFGKNWLMLTMWEVFQYNSYRLKWMIAYTSGPGTVR